MPPVGEEGGLPDPPGADGIPGVCIDENIVDIQEKQGVVSLSVEYDKE